MKKINPGQAIQAGWLRYKNNLGGYTFFLIAVLAIMFFGLIGAALFGSALMLAIGPVVPALILILLYLVSKFLWIGIAHVARKDEETGSIQFADFFWAFQINRRKLFGVFFMSFILYQIMASFAPFSQEYASILESVPQNPSETEAQMFFEESYEVISNNPLPIIFHLGILFFVRFMFSFAAFRSSLDSSSSFHSIKWSILSVIPNVIPVFFWYFLFSVLLTLISLCYAYIGVIAYVPLITLIPWMLLVKYDMYDQLCDKPEGHDPVVEEFNYDN